MITKTRQIQKFSRVWFEVWDAWFLKKKKRSMDAYHAYIIPCILFGVRLVSHYIKALTMTVFGSCKIFSGKYCYFRERKIFLSVWLHYENCSRKYFHVFDNILKMLFSITNHTKPTTTQ